MHQVPHTALPDNWHQTWAARIDEAQTLTHEVIAGKEYPRIAYGTDYPNGKEKCRVCGVAHGLLHIVGCCVERCAACGGQAITCGCADDDEATA